MYHSLLVFLSFGNFMPDTPVFIGGFRSGTTLLINLLGLHPALAPWFETKFLCEALRWMRVLREPGAASFEADYCAPPEPAGFALHQVAERMALDMRATFARQAGREDSGKAAHERYPVGHDCTCYTPAQASRALADWRAGLGGDADYGATAAATGKLIETLGGAHRQGLRRARWINKTPEISRFARELRDCLGPCRIVYLLRNGLDVVSSANALGWGDVERLAFNWKGLVELTREAMRDCPQDYLELRYEDLLAEPAAVLDRVLAFCGESPAGADIVARYTRDFGAAAFDRSRIGAGAGLGPREREAFERVAGDLQAELGYHAEPGGAEAPKG